MKACRVLIKKFQILIKNNIVKNCKSVYFLNISMYVCLYISMSVYFNISSELPTPISRKIFLNETRDVLCENIGEKEWEIDF